MINESAHTDLIKQIALKGDKDMMWKYDVRYLNVEGQEKHSFEVGKCEEEAIENAQSKEPEKITVKDVKRT